MLEWLTTRTGRNKFLARFSSGRTPQNGDSNSDSDNRSSNNDNSNHHRSNAQHQRTTMTAMPVVGQAERLSNGDDAEANHQPKSRGSEYLTYNWYLQLFSPLFVQYSNMLRTNLVLAFLVLQIMFNVWALIGELDASKEGE